MHFYDILRIISAVLVLLTSCCYFYQVIYLLLPLVRKLPKPKEGTPKRYAVLIAARNEEAVLPYLLDSIQSQDYPKAYVTTYVVADNCTDSTAQIARSHGAVVYERFHTERIGKGYAINYLLDCIDRDGGLDRYDAFLIFDADNLLDSGYIRQINNLCAAGYDAFCGFRNTKNFGGNWLSSGYGLWYLHDSTHLNRSRMTLGTSCAVSGTGFGFTRQLLERMGGWNYFTLTEDIEFNTWCATHGVRIGYTHDAVLYDEQPEDFGISWRQRTRWTQGGIQVSLKYGTQLLRGIFQGGRAGYASFETATLSLWGYGLSAVSGIMTLLVTVLTTGITGLSMALIMAIAGTYASMFAMGALTLLMEWNRIHAGNRQKIQALFTFPIFMFTFLPIAATAIFRKFQWTPIKHSVAIPVKQFQNK